MQGGYRDMRRSPAVAGTFYPHRPEELRKELERCMPSDLAKVRARAVLVPHAGGDIHDPVDILQAVKEAAK